MATIDIGAGASAFASTTGSGLYTRIDLTNPANDTGTLSMFQVYANSSISGLKIGTFSGSGNTWTCRDYESIGSVTAGSVQTFSGLDCSVATGDCIAESASSSGLAYSATGGSGVYYTMEDGMLNNYTNYILAANLKMALYGESASGWTGKIWGVTNPSKILGVSVTTISKVGGV